MTEKKKLGDVLKEAGLLDDFQLGSALSHQRNWGGKLGSIIVELGFVQESELARVLAEKLHLPYADLFEPEIPEAIIHLIKPEIAKKYQVMPVKKDGKSLVLAMADPMDLEAMDAIRFIVGHNIKPALALASEIEDAIKKYYYHEQITRKPPQPGDFAQKSLSGKMELIRGSDLNMQKARETDAASPILSREDAAQQMQADTKVRLDALITVLIEKGLVTREELVNMIYQKKMGL
jgi:type II secretory ATPase GspE/PulE/Tfp pilus assembly ATPase PilB-like protein